MSIGLMAVLNKSAVYRAIIELSNCTIGLIILPECFLYVPLLSGASVGFFRIDFGVSSGSACRYTGFNLSTDMLHVLS